MPAVRWGPGRPRKLKIVAVVGFRRGIKKGARRSIETYMGAGMFMRGPAVIPRRIAAPNRDRA